MCVFSSFDTNVSAIYSHARTKIINIMRNDKKKISRCTRRSSEHCTESNAQIRNSENNGNKITNRENISKNITERLFVI